MARERHVQGGGKRISGLEDSLSKRRRAVARQLGAAKREVIYRGEQIASAASSSKRRASRRRARLSSSGNDAFPPFPPSALADLGQWDWSGLDVINSYREIYRRGMLTGRIDIMAPGLMTRLALADNALWFFPLLLRLLLWLGHQLRRDVFANESTRRARCLENRLQSRGEYNSSTGWGKSRSKRRVPDVATINEQSCSESIDAEACRS